MTIHKRRGSGYGWYYAGFALLVVGLVAFVAMLAAGSAGVELRPFRPLAYLLVLGAIAGAIKLRSARR